MTRSALLTACFATLSLAACGQAPKPKGANAAVGVFTSAPDCAANEKVKLADCNALIQQVIATHQLTAKSYISLRLCEETEGLDH